jgi:hypothetical protein
MIRGALFPPPKRRPPRLLSGARRRALESLICRLYRARGYASRWASIDSCRGTRLRSCDCDAVDNAVIDSVFLWTSTRLAGPCRVRNRPHP